jgi:KDO2-lipid IV(A) lauroyltransferase
MMKHTLKKIRWAAEACILYFFYFIFALLPVDFASALGAAVGRNIGPRLGISRRALHQIQTCFPDKTDREHTRILHDMWDHLGRIFAEYSHLQTLAYERCTIIIPENLRATVLGDQPCIFISAHIGNWEILGPCGMRALSVPQTLTYRSLNNPWADALLRRARTLGGRIAALPKERQSARKMIETLKNGGSLGIMIDQKYNEGIAVDFFGMPAKTNPIALQLATKMNVPLIPVRIRRTNGANFEFIFYPSITIDPEQTQESTILSIHHLIEDWIRSTPEQWLWLHQRWGKL